MFTSVTAISMVSSKNLEYYRTPWEEVVEKLSKQRGWNVRRNIRPSETTLDRKYKTMVCDVDLSLKESEKVMKTLETSNLMLSDTFSTGIPEGYVSFEKYLLRSVEYLLPVEYLRDALVWYVGVASNEDYTMSYFYEEYNSWEFRSKLIEFVKKLIDMNYKISNDLYDKYSDVIDYFITFRCGGGGFVKKRLHEVKGASTLIEHFGLISLGGYLKFVGYIVR